MFETNNKIRQEDLEELANEKIFEEFAGKTVLVTGASGLIGSEIVLGFLCADRLKKLNIKVLAMVRNEQKARDVFECVLENKNFELIIQDVNNPVSYRGNVDYIIHCASTTSSGEIISKPVETARTSFWGTYNILKYAFEHKVKSFVYLSSIEIYGKTNDSNEDIKEENLGVLNPLNVRNVYPLSKKLAENLCVDFACEYGVNAKIARLTQTFGAGIAQEENRVFAQFCRSVIEKKDIVLHTDGSSFKNYCYLTDAVSAILTILIKGENGKAYNVANYDTGISIKNMAEMLAKKYGLKVVYDVSDKNRGYNESIHIKLNPEKLEALGWEPKIYLEEMFERLINSLEE